VKDIYLHYKQKNNQQVETRKLRLLSMFTTAVIGVTVFIIALTPPSLIWLINMFAFGGLETAFFWTLVLGLFWKKANRLGAMMSTVGGTIIYCFTQAIGFKIFDLHQITIGITCSLILFLIGSYIGESEDNETLKTFFP